MEGGATRLLRDIAGVAVLTPVLVAGTSPVLEPLWRGLLVGGIAVLVSFDGLRTEHLSVGRAVLAAIVVGGLLALATLMVGTSTAQLGARAAVLLVLWYGARGMAGVFAGDNRHRAVTLLEYGAFVLIALGALRLVALQS